MRWSTLGFALILGGCPSPRDPVERCEASGASLTSVGGLDETEEHEIDGGVWFVVPRASSFEISLSTDHLQGCLAQLAAAGGQATASLILDGTDQEVDSGAMIEVDTDSARGEQITLRTQLAPDAPVGAFGVRVSFGEAVIEPSERLVVLFNARSSDTVESVAPLGAGAWETYVGTGVRTEWISSTNVRSPELWTFDYSSTDNLIDALELLGDLSLADRRDPGRVALEVMARLPYEEVLTRGAGGVGPASLSPWLFDDGALDATVCPRKQPVKFGQCWVFSGLGTSMARRIGIPAQNVTNTDHGHRCLSGDSQRSRWYTQEEGSGGPLPMTDVDETTWDSYTWPEVYLSGSQGGGWSGVDLSCAESSDGVEELILVPVSELVEARNVSST